MAETNPAAPKLSIDQVGIVIRDLHAMMATLKDLFGVENFRVMEWPIEGTDPQATYHGQPGNFRLLLAFATVGSTQLELIQPLEGQNIYSDFLETHGPGLHHIRVTAPDFEARVQDMAARGIENIASGTGMHVGSRWAYFDTSAILEGVIVELRKQLDEAGGAGKWIIQDGAGAPSA